MPQDPYADWYSGTYSGCALCHYAHAQDKSILTNSELSLADQNIREWAAVGYTPIVGTAAIGGGATAVSAYAYPVFYNIAFTCLKISLCANAIGAGGGVTVLGKIKPGQNPPGYVNIGNQINGRTLHTPNWTPELQSQFMEETKRLGNPVFLTDNPSLYPGSVLATEVKDLAQSGWRMILNVMMYPPNK
jgi:hypothetical protein